MIKSASAWALALVVLALALPTGATAEQASQPSLPAAGQLDAGGQHTCAVVAGDVRCWGLGFTGQLGYGNKANIGDNEAPGTVGPVNIGTGRTATAIAAGDSHTCALLDGGSVRCWGFGQDGRLGYGNENDIGDDESPGSVGTVNLGTGRTATAITAGSAHTCALRDDKKVLCWGFGADGRLGYATEDPTTFASETVGDDETPGSVEPLDLGGDATAISAGGAHTCAVLEGGSVRCWGVAGTQFGGDGRLGYGNALDIGDNETPGSVEPVNLGAGRTATAISAGDVHTCAVLNDAPPEGNVLCWGSRLGGRVGYNNRTDRAVGDNETPGSAGPVDVGGSATAISAGKHTCARLVDGNVRCWGPAGVSAGSPGPPVVPARPIGDGRLGYAGANDIGDNEPPRLAGPVNLGSARSAVAISAGGGNEFGAHTCARLDNLSLRCWGEGLYGRLGYGNQTNIGDDETPAAAGPVDVRTRVSIDDRTVSEGNSGERTVTFTVRRTSSRETASVAYATGNETARAPADYTTQSGTLSFAAGATTRTVAVRVKGDTLDEPNERFRVNLSSPTNLVIADAVGTGTIIDDDAAVYAVDPEAAALRAQAARQRGLRSCLAKAKRHTRRETRRARGLGGRRGARARRHARSHKGRMRRACLKRWGRIPGRVTDLRARPRSGGTIALTFKAAGTHGSRPPAARSYVVKQSRRPIRSARAFRRAQTLCDGSCRFPAGTRVGATITLRVTDLRRRATYYYSVAAKDNVSGRLGPRSRAARARAR